MDGVQLPQGWSHFEEAVYFLPLTLAELFNMCQRIFAFQALHVVPVFKNIGKRSIAKNYQPVSLLFVVSKIFETHVNNRLADHLENCNLFPDFQYSFWSS